MPFTTSVDIGNFIQAATKAAGRTVLGVGTGDSPTFVAGTFTGTSTLTLGTAGSLVGNIGFKNATSGTATIAPPTGALGTFTVTLPNAASTLPIFGQQVTFTGPTQARSYALPDAAATLARTDAANTFTGASTASAWVLTAPTITTSIVPTTSDGAALGSTSNQFADLHLATGALITFAATNVIITHTSGILTMGTGDFRVTNAGTNSASVVTVGGTQTLTSKTLDAPTLTNTTTAATVAATTVTAGALNPSGDNTIPLGTTSLQWSDLFLGTGAVINYNNGNVVVTHSSGILTMGTGEMRITTVGTNTASVVTVGGTQTLTAKTLTSPAITTATISGANPLAEGGSIALDPVLSADGTFTGITMGGTAGATLAFGDLIYLAVADSRWELTDADSVTTCGAVLTGMCVLAAASDGDPTVVLLHGNIRADANFPALTVGAPVYASTTPGDIQVAQPSGTDDVIQVVGFALTADSIYFNPSQNYTTHV